ncbi:MAG: hypothetical protein ACYS0G_15645 [Planctomycetota bacterium]|jgi:hypothetical protein
MPRTRRYDLAFNWAANRPTPFTDAVTESARRHRIAVLSVGRGEVDAVRRRVERGRIGIGVFLNTQAEGISLESPSMRLARILKARGALVVEDPDDAPVYADRALQLEYLQRAGLPVPQHLVLERQSGGPVITTAARSTLGQTWAAVAARGLTRRAAVVSTAKHIWPALVRSGFKRGQKILVYRHQEPVFEGDMELRFRIWYLFGRIIPSWRRRDRSHFQRLTLDDIRHDAVTQMIAMVRRCAEITGLDWFMTELHVTGSARRRKVIVLEPPNALAGLGPGVAVLSETSSEIMRLAAQRLVDVAWRRARGLPLSDGTGVWLAAGRSPS